MEMPLVKELRVSKTEEAARQPPGDGLGASPPPGFLKIISENEILQLRFRRAFRFAVRIVAVKDVCHSADNLAFQIKLPIRLCR
jgi:hypothetical protein